MRNDLMRKEIKEASQAGERALASLYKAQERLQGARNWGIFDMLGGGFLADWMKHTRMSDASVYMEDAREQLCIFQKELRDVQVPLEIRMEINTFLSFADFFFDGLIADYLVQSKINEAREQVDDAIMHVSYLLEELKTLMND